MSIKTTPEEYTTLQKKAAQWVESATPEQKQKITVALQQAAGMAESFGKAFDSIMQRNRGATAKSLSLHVDMPPKAITLLNAYIEHGEASAALMEHLDELREDKRINASPFVAAFVNRLCEDIGQSYDPFEVLASHYQVEARKGRRKSAIKAVKSRKDRLVLDDVEDFAIQLYKQGPMSGQWKDNPTAARSIESTVNAKAKELGWERKKTQYSYQTIQRWIEKDLAPTE